MKMTTKDTIQLTRSIMETSGQVIKGFSPLDKNEVQTEFLKACAPVYDAMQHYYQKNMALSRFRDYGHNPSEKEIEAAVKLFNDNFTVRIAEYDQWFEAVMTVIHSHS